MTPKRCGTCKWLKLGAGERRFSSRRSYKCDWPAPELPALPDSITTGFMFTPVTGAHRMSMETREGTLCPCWEPRT